ncbi:MAG: hypothetical protein AB7U82_27655 [Blastocatellales bacterium]
MPASTTNFDSTRIMTGPSKVWIDVAVPAGGARMTLDNTTGTPESVANPNAKHIGLTEAGVTMSVKTEIQSFEADELTAPWRQQLSNEEAVMSGNFLQIEDWDILGLITPGGTKSTGSGYEQLTFGGLTTVTTKSVACIAESADTAGKWVVFQLYKAFNRAGIELALSRKDFSKVPFEFIGLSDTSRTQGDQVGNFWRQV